MPLHETFGSVIQADVESFERSQDLRLPSSHRRNERVALALIDEPELLVQRCTVLTPVHIGLDTILVCEVAAPFHEHGAGTSALVVGVCRE